MSSSGTRTNGNSAGNTKKSSSPPPSAPPESQVRPPVSSSAFRNRISAYHADYVDDSHYDPWSDTTASTQRQDNPRRQQQHHQGYHDDDPYDLKERFVRNQRLSYDQALAEIRQGAKRSCWLWFVLPSDPYVVNGVERGSSMNRHFALRGDDTVRAYLQFEAQGVNLRHNYLTIVSAIVSQLEYGNTLTNLLGPLDRDKAVSSFRLFERISREMGDNELANVCKRILDFAAKEPKKKQKSHGFSLY